jgi:hypothetical protein
MGIGIGMGFAIHEAAVAKEIGGHMGPLCRGLAQTTPIGLRTQVRLTQWYAAAYL